MDAGVTFDTLICTASLTSVDAESKVKFTEVEAEKVAEETLP